MEIINKRIILILKIIYLCYLLTVVNHIEDELIMFIGSPILFFTSIMSLSIIMKNGKYLYFTNILFSVILIIGFIVDSKFILLSSVIICVIETLVKNEYEKKINKRFILVAIFSAFLLSISFSYFYTYCNIWIYILILAFITLLFFLIYNYRLVNKDGKSKKNYLQLILMLVWLIPSFFSIKLSENNIHISLELMIYSMLIAVYPFGRILIIIYNESKSD